MNNPSNAEKSLQPVSDRMRADWNDRAREDAHYYVAFGALQQSEEDFAATAADVIRLLERDLRRFPKGVPLRALEIGCGPGRLMKPLSRHFAEIHGVDVSDEMIRIARERLKDIPHAHVHATNGADLSEFPADSFDFVYSYAVFQHIPSRDVVFEYLRETRRVLKPGGIFHGQFNSLRLSHAVDTWRGVTFSADDIRAFTREQGLQLMSLEGAETLQMWATWRKRPASVTASTGAPRIRRLTNAYTSEPLIPSRGRNAAVSLQVENFPADCDLNTLGVLIDGIPSTPLYIGPSEDVGVQQVNAWLPGDVRTGIVPVELLWNGSRMCPPATVRVVPAGPLVPRIVSISDGINISDSRITTGLLKIKIEEVRTPESIEVWVDDRRLELLANTCIDPVPPRYEVDARLPPDLRPGAHRLEIRIGRRRLLPAEIQVT